MSICVVCKYGWIIKGLEDENSTAKDMILHDSAVVRRWTNGKGIGGISKAENKGDYTLDSIGDVIINRDNVLFSIPCEW